MDAVKESELKMWVIVGQVLKPNEWFRKKEMEDEGFKFRAHYTKHQFDGWERIK